MTRSLIRGLMALALLLAPLGAAAQAPVLCPGTPTSPADFDTDGFSDAAECAGITLVPTLRVVENGGTGLPRCATGVARSLCVDPGTRDVFVILDRSTQQLPLPADALAIYASLGITLHKLVRTDTGTSRQVSVASAQNAIQIATDPSTGGEVNGRANWGTPNNLDGVTVLPNRIAKFVSDTCPATKTCMTQTGLQRGPAAIAPVFTRWVTDHEAGHTLALTRVPNDRYYGYHEPTGSLTVMEWTPKVVDKRGIVTFFIGNAFSAVSGNDATIAGRK